MRLFFVAAMLSSEYASALAAAQKYSFYAEKGGASQLTKPKMATKKQKDYNPNDRQE